VLKRFGEFATLNFPPSVRSLEAQDEPYDAADDFSRSLDNCYAAVRERVAAGGKGWEPP
jgi:hypothetical protein